MSTPVTVGENTSNRRVSAVTGMLRLVVMPLLTVPIAIAPLKDGDKVTRAPGTSVKSLSGAVDWNS